MEDTEKFIKLDPNAYSTDAILATSYWFSNQQTIKIVESSPLIIISISSRDNKPISQDVIDDILVRLTDEELRSRLKQKFNAIETSIVQAAFAPILTIPSKLNK